MTVKILLLISLIGLICADINVKIDRHFPCSAASGPSKQNLRIKFPSYKSTGVNFREEKNEQGHKCFRMSGGKVEVYPPGLDGSKKYYVHLETRIGIHGKPERFEVYPPGLDGSKKYYVHLETRIGIHGKPERCVNADKNGCGGIGSCVHCDICKSMGGAFKNFVQIFQKDAPAKCSADGLKAGSYDDLSLKICLPSKNELLPFLDSNVDRAQQIWNLFISTRARLFDRPINKLSTKELNDALHGSKEGMVGSVMCVRHRRVSQPRVTKVHHRFRFRFFFSTKALFVIIGFGELSGTSDSDHF
uniref:Uncharacterized protein n=1 Tax=Panagrolaimus sp. JU765 TaxID=591449 RepID=A0AC34Q6Q2_9BILA